VNGTITIANVTAADAGLYVCIAENPVGSKSATLLVDVLQTTQTASAFTLPVLFGTIFGSTAGALLLIAAIVMTLWCRRNNNSPSERRVLFSVWSPFSTNNPREIPADQRIQLLAKGERVRVGQFGNEGSGGQSFLLYPWQAGKTYRFLTKVKPDGKGNTIYTSWFGDKAKDEWILIASFLRPKTDTNLRRFHSFLENFSPSTGHLGRKGSYGNIWCRSIDGEWFACQQARFTTDATGRGRHRLDFAGGASGSSFYLRNCGFFSPYTQPDTNLSLETQSLEPPQIDFQSLPTQ